MGVYTDALLEAEGFDSVDEMLERFVFESVVPGVCRDAECLGTMEVEPDQDKGWCCVCNKTTVVSCLRLWGMI
jgi:hypothetical protein